MLAKLLLLALALLGYFWLRSWYRDLDPDARKKATWNIAVGALFVVMLVAFLTGRMHWAGLAFAVVLGALKFLTTTAIRLSPFLFSAARAKSLSSPQINTPFLSVKIRFGDVVTLEGEVKEGPHAGENLQDLDREKLLELANYYKDKCKRSYYLILVALQNKGESQSPNNFDDVPEMTYEEAKLILGIQGEFAAEDVKLAHRRLIQKLHPDKGGNAYLAARVNLAKDVLLRQL